jgi:hypothetical protein
MAKAKKIEEGELAKLKSLNLRVNTMRDQIAESSIRHQILIAQYPTVEAESMSYQNEITQKYGNIRLNMSTGEYTMKDENKN